MEVDVEVEVRGLVLYCMAAEGITPKDITPKV